MLETLYHTILNGYSNYYNYVAHTLLVPSWGNYFYWLLAISLVVWLLEILLPWRTNQAIVRKDFWLDGFYMFFNYFIFSLIGYNAISDVGVLLWNKLLAIFGYTNIVAIKLGHLPIWLQLVIMFVIADFIQWNIHRAMHKNTTLWQFHKVHHSVQEMGFAAHFRFHFMETVIYKSLQYIPLAMLGFGLQSFFIIHIIAISIGHLNHSNIRVNYGWLGYIFNNPVMHLHHHSKYVPKGAYGVNFGLSLSCWDYIFGTAYIPNTNANTELGFTNVAQYPNSFLKQVLQPFKKKINL